MAQNIKEIPFTEICERVSDTARIDTDNEKAKVRGMVNDVYTKEFPRKYDWTFLMVQTNIVCTAVYNSGTVSVNTQDSTCTFAGATISTDMTGRKIKFDGNDNIYDFTYADSTGGTINPPLSGDTNVSSEGYNIFQPFYALPPDFERFPKEGGILKYSGGKMSQKSELRHMDYYESYNPNPTNNPEGVRLFGTNTAGNQLIEIIPPPQDAIVLGCEYIRGLSPMRETSAGTVTIAKTDATAYITNGDLVEVKTGDYLRVTDLGDRADSQWFRINAINGTALSITTFANTAVADAAYIISSVPDIPYKMHDGMIWGALRNTVMDVGDKMFAFYNMKFAEVLSDGKTLTKGRLPNYPVSGVFTETGYRR